MSSPSSHSIIEEDGVVQLGKLLKIIKYLSISSLIYGMKVLSLTSRSVGRSKPRNIPSYHTVKVDILGMNSSSLEMAIAGSLAYKEIYPASLKETVRASNLESETWFQSLVLPLILSMSTLQSQVSTGKCG